MILGVPACRNPKGKPKWNPTPHPAKTQCPQRPFVPMACHKCWHWNRRTWGHITQTCPEAVAMRKLRAQYKVGVEFTGWPTRPKPKPARGRVLPDARWQPIDMLRDVCRGECKVAPPPHFERTKKGAYHK